MRAALDRGGHWRYRGQLRHCGPARKSRLTLPQGRRRRPRCDGSLKQLCGTIGCMESSPAIVTAASGGLAAEQSNDRLNEKPRILRRPDATCEFCIYERRFRDVHVAPDLPPTPGSSRHCSEPMSGGFVNWHATYTVRSANI
jgi:hypothetical protein